jgi:hypothetical protein
MDGSESPADIPQPAHIVLRPQYREALAVFDAAVCEALAVGQEIGVRLAEPHIGYATHVFARICSHANAMITAAPLSRWVRRDHQNWDFSAVCGHARSVIEGYLLFRYLIDAPANEEGAVHAMVKVMHLYDCTTRIKVLRHHATAEEIEGFERQAVEIRERLLSNEWFTTLGSKLQKELLSGKHLMVKTRDQQLDALGWLRAISIICGMFYRNIRTFYLFLFIAWSPTGEARGWRMISTAPISQWLWSNVPPSW